MIILLFSNSAWAPNPKNPIVSETANGLWYNILNRCGGCKVQKNEIYEMTADDLTLEGNGVGRIENMAVFVPGLLP